MYRLVATDRAGLSTITDSMGRFELGALAAGSYIVRVRRRGLRSANHLMQILDDDHRGITLKLFGLAGRPGSRDTATASGYGAADLGFDAFDRRERTGSGSVIVGPADLVRANGVPLDFLLQQYRTDASMHRRSGTVREGVGSTDDGDCLLLDECRGSTDHHPSYFMLWTRALR